ncbi:hypothetical protein NECAME_16956 [Necator americanus]|uniref:Transthyretin-like family protein n=1 Tax=Necator americanus TaxID=51031 RepID=W2TVC6_NECAM|nr:hypothetical protein NECAME_16956 [Necator americanus]ETN85021.1 hypothetical protein NECAME_16956 [Necator americanus]
MFRSLFVLLAIGTVTVTSKCVDGKDNVITFHDTTNGKGKILVKDFQVGTYDQNKKPICTDGKPQFTFPGHFKLLKGTVEVREPVEDGANPLQLAISLEKNSFLVGVVCEEGKSKNQFVPDEITFDLCKISSLCGLLSVKTPSPIDVTKLVQKEYIDMGAMPIPQLSVSAFVKFNICSKQSDQVLDKKGEWQLSVKLIQGKRVLGGLRVGKGSEWLNIESVEGEGKLDITRSAPEAHEEL